MSFLTPAWLLVGLAAAGIVVLLHRLRPRKKRVVVSSLLLWKELERHIAANRTRRRLLMSLLLFAQVAALLLLAVALAGPRTPVPEFPLHLVVLLDTSASMGVERGGRSRLNAGQERIEAFLQSGEAERYTLITSSGPPVRYDGRDRQAFVQSLGNLPAPAGRSDWETALETLRAHVAPDGPLVLLLVTDGAFEEHRIALLDDLSDDARAFSINTGFSAPNVGIVEFSARPQGDEPGLHQVLVRVANASAAARSVPLRVDAQAHPALDGEGPTRSVLQTTLSLDASETRDVLFNYAFAPGDALRAELDVDDALVQDNAAYLTADRQRSLRVLHVGRSSPLLRQSLAAILHVEVHDTLLLAPPPSVTADFDLVLFYDQPVPEHFEGTALALVSGSAAAERAPQQPSSVEWWNETHALSRFVEWSTLNIGPAAPMDLRPGERVLVLSERGPVVTLEESERRRVVRVSIPLEQSDFPTRVAYPIFLHNVVNWATPRHSEWVSPPLAPGSVPDALRTAAVNSGAPAELTRWDWSTGSAQRSLYDPSLGDAERSLTWAPGLYSWQAGARTGVFSTGLLSASETDISPRQPVSSAHLYGIPALDGLGLRDAASGLRGLSELGDRPHTAWDGRWLAFLAALLLALESFLYMRRHHARLTKRRPISVPHNPRTAQSGAASGSGREVSP